LNCIAHFAVPAVNRCGICGAGLCPACSTRFTLVRCEPCLLKGNREATKQAYKGLCITVILFAIGIYVGFLWASSLGLPGKQIVGTGMPFQMSPQSTAASTYPRKHQSPASALSSKQKAPSSPVPVPASPQNSPTQRAEGLSFGRKVLFSCFLGWVVACVYWGIKTVRQQTRMIVAGTPGMILWSFVGYFMGSIMVGAIALPRLMRTWIRDIVISRRYLALRNNNF